MADGWFERTGIILAAFLRWPMHVRARHACEIFRNLLKLATAARLDRLFGKSGIGTCVRAPLLRLRRECAYRGERASDLRRCGVFRGRRVAQRPADHRRPDRRNRGHGLSGKCSAALIVTKHAYFSSGRGNRQ